jgi:hypothetical protein
MMIFQHMSSVLLLMCYRIIIAQNMYNHKRLRYKPYAIQSTTQQILLRYESKKTT